VITIPKVLHSAIITTSGRRGLLQHVAADDVKLHRLINLSLFAKPLDRDNILEGMIIMTTRNGYDSKTQETRTAAEKNPIL
jgi:hypothetical protein